MASHAKNRMFLLRMNLLSRTTDIGGDLSLHKKDNAKFYFMNVANENLVSQNKFKKIVSQKNPYCGMNE